MKRVLASTLLLAFLPVAASLTAQPQNKDDIAKISLKVGDRAPDFSLPSNERTTVKLSDFHGKKNVLLAVYILAFTGG